MNSYAAQVKSSSGSAVQHKLQSTPYWIFTRCVGCNVDLMFEEPERCVHSFMKITCPDCGRIFEARSPNIGAHYHTGDLDTDIAINESSSVEILKVSGALSSATAGSVAQALKDPLCRPFAGRNIAGTRPLHILRRVFAWLFFLSLLALIPVPLFVAPLWTAIPIFIVAVISFKTLRPIDARIDLMTGNIPVMYLSMIVYESASGGVYKVMACHAEGGLKGYFRRARGEQPPQPRANPSSVIDEILSLEGNLDREM